jgi:hypothetical protein
MLRKRPFPDAGIALFLFAVMSFTVFFMAPYRIGFKEQIGIFYWSHDRLLWYLSNPAVLSSIAGDWLTQFFYFNTCGVIITLLLLTLLWLGMLRLSRLVRGKSPAYTLSLLPVMIVASFIVWPHYPLSALIGVVLSVWMACLLAHFNNRTLRMVSIILGVPLAFVLFGGSFTVFALACLFQKKGKVRFDLIAAAAGVLITVLLSSFYNLPFKQILLYPVTIGYMLPRLVNMYLLPICVAACILLSSFGRHILTVAISAACSIFFVTKIYDDVLEFSVQVGTLAYRSDWDAVRELSNKNLDTQYGLYYRNLSYAREGTLPDELLGCDQGLLSDGLFLHTTIKDPYLSKFYFTDALLEMGDVSQATDCALLAQTVTPGYYSTRILRRLAEISVITGDYGVASKYLDILSKTRFHSEWADNLMECIGKDSIPKQYLVLRSRTANSDRFFDLGDVHSSLYVISSANPTNRCAIDYLMCASLLDKDMDNFRYLYDRFWLGGLERYFAVPELYQEALLLDADSEESLNQIVNRYRISPNVLNRFYSFMEIRSRNVSGLRVHRELHKTYWYYALTTLETYTE